MTPGTTDREPHDVALPFPSEPLRAGRPGLRAVCGRLAFWSPVWIPLALLAQIALLGLAPARDEAQRLENAGTALEQRLELELAERQTLERVLRAQDDPIYLERERRLLRAQAAVPGTADPDAAGEGPARTDGAR
jgi:hypothetical protein